jgi:hypothetical protein
MKTGSCLRQGILFWLAIGLPVVAFGQSTPRVAPVPRDSLELATGPIQTLDSNVKKDAALKLLARARSSYALKNLRQPWNLKVRFTVNSEGQTNYDGAWEMEDVFSPGLGLYWTAKSSTNYSIAGIFGNNETWAESSESIVPLRLQEARGMLYNPLPSVSYAESGIMRSSAAVFHDTPVLCILMSRSRDTSATPAQRGWDETEECIDSETGLLQVHSEAPGRYTVYDYTGGVRLGSHLMPKTVTILEGGKTVSTISVQSLEIAGSVDAGLFVPTDGMKAAGPAVAMTSSTRISRNQQQGAIAPGMTVRPVCVMGLVTPEGHLVDAHSLQPSDPNSEAAVKDAQSIDFSPSMREGTPAQQHFVFVIEKFVVQQ